MIICLKWRRSFYIFFCFPIQESSRNSKTSLFRTQRPWLASLICVTALKLLPDHSRCQASTTIRQVVVVWGQSRPVPEGRRSRRLMWFVPIKMMTPFYFFPFLRSGKSWISYLQSELVKICPQKDVFCTWQHLTSLYLGGYTRWHSKVAGVGLVATWVTKGLNNIES